MLRQFHTSNLKLYLEKVGSSKQQQQQDGDEFTNDDRNNILEDKEKRDEIIKSFSAEMDALITQELPNMTDDNKERHIYTAIVTMAMDTAFVHVGMNDEECKKHILGNWRFMVRPLYRGIAGRLRRCDDANKVRGMNHITNILFLRPGRLVKLLDFRMGVN